MIIAEQKIEELSDHLLIPDNGYPNHPHMVGMSPMERVVTVMGELSRGGWGSSKADRGNENE